MAVPIKPISPLTGVLDLRSSTDEMPADSLRFRQNLQTVGEGKLRRGSGFKKFLDKSNYNNSDLHDQLLALSGASGRQPITLLFEAESTRRIRTLFAATQSTLFELNSHSGNYRVMGTGFGGTVSTSANAPRFKAARVGDYVALTNDFDKVQFARLEQAPDPTTGKLLYTNDELDTIGLSQAKVIWEWKNVLFLADVTMDGERASNRIVWSDFDNPFGDGSFDPAVLSSIAGFKDLYTYEQVLAGAPTGNSFLIYTTHGIWEMSAVGGEQSFDFRRVYNGEKDEFKAVLAYPNTLTNLHDAHCYIGRDGVYFFGAYYPAPDRPEWLHRATSDLLDTLDKTACDAHVSGIYGDEVYFSVARMGALNQCPDYTLRLNKTYHTADVVDCGFTIYAQFSPQDIQDIRDFIVEEGICTIEGLSAQGFPYGMEGLPRSLPSRPVDAHGYYIVPSHFYTDDTITSDCGHGYYVVTEDPHGYPISNSLCAFLDGEILDEFCRTCKQDPLFLGASSNDWCIKEIGKVFYREICANPTAVGLVGANGYSAAFGSYLLNPIESILRFAPSFASDAEIVLSQLELKAVPVFQDPPLQVALRVGISAQPADPNTGEAIVFHPMLSKTLAYQSQKTPTQHLTDNTKPTSRIKWNMWWVGRFLYVELVINGVGGDAVFSSLEAELALHNRTKNY